VGTRTIPWNVASRGKTRKDELEYTRRALDLFPEWKQRGHWRARSIGEWHMWAALLIVMGGSVPLGGAVTIPF
jgi:hypothetical protein